MASVREQAVGLLNDAKLQADSSSKVDFLKQVMELVLHRDPELLPEFLPHLLEFQSEKGWFLRKYLTEIVELVGMKFLKHVPVMIPTLLVLLQDSAPGVIQRAIITATHLFGYTFEQLVLQGIYSGHVEPWLVDAWGGMLKVKEAVFPTASQHSNDVVRLHGIKFIESTILLFTPDPNSSARPSLQAEGASKDCNVAWIAGGHPILSSTELGHEASRSLGILLDQLRAPDVSVLPGPVAIVLLNSLGNIAKKRPTLFGRILPVLIALGPNCEAIRGSQVTSVIHTLRTNLLGLLKCTHTGAAPWRDRLMAALRAMNAGESAEAALRQIGRVQRTADRDTTADRRVVKDERLPGASSLFISSGPEAGRKRNIVQENGNLAGDADEAVKRLRGNYTAQNLMSNTPLQSDGQYTVPRDGRGITTKAGGRVSTHQQVIDMTAALIAHGGERAASTIETLVERLPAEVLADVVMANMRHMPANSPGLSNGPVTGSATPDLAALIAASVGDPRRDPRRPDRLAERETGRVDLGGAESLAPVKSEGAGSWDARLSIAMKTEDVPGPLSRDPRSALRGQPLPLPTANFRPMTVKVEPVDGAPDSKGTGEGGLPFGGEFDIPGGLQSNSTSTARAFSHSQAPAHSLQSSAVKIEDAINVGSSAINRALTQPPGLTSAVPGPVPVLPLSEEQQHALCKAAVMRILESQKAVAAAGGSDLRTALLARLVAQSREDGVLEVFRKYLLADYHGHKGHELALHVLYQLYADQASNPDSPPNLSEIDPAYDTFLLLLAEGLRDTLPPSDKSLSRLFGEAPVLPSSALKLLEGLCNPSSQIKEEKEALNAERITQGLSTIWSLILQRPPARETCLQIALQCAVHEQEAVRTKAIRLVANKLYPVSYIALKIEAFATDLLLSVLDVRQSSHKSPEKMNVDASSCQAVEPVKKMEQLNGVEGKGSAEGQAVDEKVIAVDGQRSTKSSSAAFMAEAQRCMSLFFALCTKKHSLLGQLFSVYGRASKEFKQVVKQKIPLVVRSIGASSSELLNIIADPPAGSLNLLLGVLHNLSEGGTLSQELISAVKKLYETKLHDANFLIPILSSFSKEEVLPIFPRLVELPPESFQSSLDRILQGSAHTGPAMTPAEVLIALHDIDPRRDSVALKKITDACSACLQQRTVFTQQVLAKVLNQMVEQTPLPLLFMRTVIQAVGAFPSLVDFVMEILSRLVNKQIWKNPKLWVGFLKCANQTMPHSFHVLLQLPAVQLEDALNRQPTLRAPLAAHASQPNIRATVPRSSLVLLGIIQDVPVVESTAPTAPTAPTVPPPAEISTA